jgi:hypothetical protein
MKLIPDSFRKPVAAGIAALSIAGTNLDNSVALSQQPNNSRLTSTTSLSQKIDNQDFFSNLSNLASEVLKPYNLLSNDNEKNAFGEKLKILQKSLQDRPDVSEDKALRAPINFVNNIHWLSQQQHLLENLSGKNRSYSKTEVFRFLVEGNSAIDMQARNGILNAVYSAATGTGNRANFKGKEKAILTEGLDRFFEPNLHSDLAFRNNNRLNTNSNELVMSR